MMPMLTTPVEVGRMPFRIDFSTGMVSLGSCFADEIGERLTQSDFHLLQNPFGTLYNPASIANALERMALDRPIGADDLVEWEGLWHSWHHHGSFSRPSAADTLAACNDAIHGGHNALGQASLLMVTFGSAWVFELATGHSPFVVANCHKLPATSFVRRRMSVDEIVALWQPLLFKLHAYYPTLNVLFSVSPIRHKADGLHGNQLSKSTLLLAVEQLCTAVDGDATHPWVHYFPSYEIVLDELRDYRFYDSDMVHPSDLAVEVVWERFQRATMVPAIQQQAHFNRKQHRSEQHIPLHP